MVILTDGGNEMARSHKKKVYNLRYLLLLYWLIFIVLTVLLSFALDMVTFNSDTNLFDISFTFLNTAVISADMAFFLIVRLKIINHYKGENEMAFNFEEEYAPPIIIEETDEKEQKGKKKKRKDASDFEEIEVIREESFRLNPFWQSSSKDETFLKDCYNNNFFITLPESFNGFNIPESFRKFYLNFNFIKIFNKEDYIEKTIIDCDDMQWTAKMVDNDMLINVEIKFNTDLVSTENLDKESIKLLITISDIKLKDKEKTIKFEYLPLKKTFTDYLKIFIKKIKNCDQSKESIIEHSEQDFVSSTFITRKNMKSKNMIFSIKTENKTKEMYEVITSVYCAYSDIKCPICRNKILNLGIRGIVTYLTNTPDVCHTSSRIDEIIEKLDSEDELKKMINYVRDENLKNSNVESLVDKNNHCARIPLAKYEKENGKIKPFTTSDYEEEWNFLHKFNEGMFEGYMTKDDIKYIKGRHQLVLLKPTTGHDDEIINHYIHSSMIAQLCNNCYNPLPKDFYEYYQVISIKYFGDSSTGKTALICSEYNVNDGEENFNEINFDKENLNSSYKEKAVKLKEGKFPIGTNENENIPGKLSVLTVNDSNGTKLNYLFNKLDMMGAKAAQNWSSNQNIVYLHSLLSTTEIFNDTGDQKSLYTNVIETVQNVLDPRTYNIQIYLTKIDEFPLFLYNAIKAHNEYYSNILNSSLSDTEYLKISSDYMFELLDVLNKNLSESFYERILSDVIPKDISDYILKKLDIEYILKKSDTQHEDTYTDFFNCIVEHYMNKSTEYDDNDKLILMYLYGIHFIRENYQKFRELVYTLLKNMSKNAESNKYSYFWLSVYAVSATGFGKLRQTVNPNKGAELFKPEFVKEASLLLKHTTRIFQHEAKVSRINGRANENMYCYNQLFENNRKEFITQLNNTPIVRPPYTKCEQWLKNWYNNLLNEKAENPTISVALSC